MTTLLSSLLTETVCPVHRVGPSAGTLLFPTRHTGSAILDLGKEAQYSAVDLCWLLDQHEVAYPLDPLDLRSRPKESRDFLRCLSVERDTTVLTAVEIKGGLRERATPDSSLSPHPRRRAEAGRIEQRPVVAHGSL